MKIKDHCIWFETPGGQLSFTVILAMICSAGFFIMDAFEKAGWLNLVFAILKGLFAAGTLYLIFYAVVLSKKLTEKHYK